MVVDELYRDAADREVSSGFSFNADVLQRALRNIYYRKYDVSKDLDGHLLEEVNRIINSATDIGFSGSEADGEFMRQLRSNNEVFAAFKTHRMGRDIASRLIGEDGETKSFQQFKEDVQSITSHHVEHWLRTEYDTAIKRAQQAADMMQYRAEADVLPNLEWMPSTAMKPREEHMPFYHHIWAIDDPFWQQHKPGDQWGCQCDLAPTDKPVTDNSGLGGQTLAKPSAGLVGDPSRTGIIFSDDHPYFPNSCGNCVFNKGQLSLFTNKDKDCYQCAKVNRAIDKARKIAHQATAEELDAAYNEIRAQIIAEFDTNSFIPIPVGDSHCTGKLQLNNPSLKRCLKSYKHTRSVQSKQCLLEAARHPEQLRHIRWAELGEGKNPDDPTDAKNIAKKVKRGVIGYNRYEFEFAGKTWVLGFEVIKKGYEQPYFVIQIK